MKSIRNLMPASTDFCYPTSWIGSNLKGTREREHFGKIKQSIDYYMNNSINNANLLKIVDMIEESKAMGMSQSIPPLIEVVNLLRNQLMDSSPENVYKTIILLDVLIKNSGYRIHILIGRRKFMKTFGIVLRRHRSHVNNALNQRVSALAIDCIQAWGEAFTSRRSLYPHIYETYYKIRHKYHIRFPRPDFDPTRVPIFLGE